MSYESKTNQFDKLAKEELNLKFCKLEKVQPVIKENKRVRLLLCSQLKCSATDEGWVCILFTEDKLFAIVQAHNRQIDRVWSTEVLDMPAIVEYRQNTKSVIVWAG